LEKLIESESVNEIFELRRSSIEIDGNKNNEVKVLLLGK